MLPLFAVADAAPAHHQPLEGLLPNGDRDDMRSGDQVPPWWRARDARLSSTCCARLGQLRHTHTLRVCTVLNVCVFFPGWSFGSGCFGIFHAVSTVNPPASRDDTRCACVCVSVCPSTEPSHAEGWTEWWHTLAASCHDLIHSERDRKIARQRMGKCKHECVCVCLWVHVLYTVISHCGMLA